MTTNKTNKECCEKCVDNDFFSSQQCKFKHDPNYNCPCHQQPEKEEIEKCSICKTGGIKNGLHIVNAFPNPEPSRELEEVPEHIFCGEQTRKAIGSECGVFYFKEDVEKIILSERTALVERFKEIIMDDSYDNMIISGSSEREYAWNKIYHLLTKTK